MPRITVKFDDNLKKPEITAVLTHSSIDESGRDFMDEAKNREGVQQTNIYGILTPLISINGITVDFSDVKYFSLKNTGSTPQLYIEVFDRYRIISTLNTPSFDNVVAVQILPPFDGAYKKINLSFYISNLNINRDINLIKITGAYKVIDLVSKQYKCLGELSTYQLLEQVAKETKLGFATNWTDEPDDKRYIYCANQSYLELLNSEIKHSLSDKTRVFDYWVDYWNYINFANIYERYTTIENLDDEKNRVWISAMPYTLDEGDKIEPELLPLKLTNHPSMMNSELFINKYEIINKPGAFYSGGSDVIYSIYEENKDEYLDYLFQNQDVEKDVFRGIEYLGEVYGDYNYLLANVNREMYLKKMNVETIKVTLVHPLLAITKGCKVDVIWYNLDSMQEAKYNEFEDNGVIKNRDEINSNIPLSENLSKEQQELYNPANGEFKMDKSISGQYLVLNNCISYRDGKWFYDLTLGRPHKDKPEMLTKKIEQ